jgi:hypothetical protein
MEQDLDLRPGLLWVKMWADHLVFPGQPHS